MKSTRVIILCPTYCISCFTVPFKWLFILKLFGEMPQVFSRTHAKLSVKWNLTVQYRSIETFLYKCISFAIILKQSNDSGLGVPFPCPSKQSFSDPWEIFHKSTPRAGTKCYYTNNTTSFLLPAKDSFGVHTEILILGLGDVDGWKFLICFNHYILHL